MMMIVIVLQRPSWMLFSLIALVMISDRYYAARLVSADSQAMMYLARCGYMDPAIQSPQSGAVISGESVRRAIIDYEAFADLNQTGMLSDEAASWMSKSLCRVKVVDPIDSSTIKLLSPKVAPAAPSLPNNKRCGNLIKKMPRIVGGQPADKGEWPWMAALLRNKTDQYCGGVLITDQHVLTASHCVDSFKASDIMVRLGEYDFSQVSDSRRDFVVEAIHMHESYDRKTYRDDVALIKLKEKATLNDMIWPICLPPSNIVLEDQSAIVTGWGTTSYGGQTSDVLLEVTLPIWKLDDCQISYTKPISKNQLCAGYKRGGKDSCQGDSGGPLMLQMTSGRWAVVGIVSWGIRCAEKDKPGMYTRVTAYSDWIKEKILVS